MRIESRKVMSVVVANKISEEPCLAGPIGADWDCCNVFEDLQNVLCIS